MGEKKPTSSWMHMTTIIQWHNSHVPDTFKLLLSHTDLAQSVCWSIIDKDVQKVDGMASVNFSSSFFFTGWPRKASLTTSHSKNSVMHLIKGWVLAGVLPAAQTLGTGSALGLAS